MNEEDKVIWYDENGFPNIERTKLIKTALKPRLDELNEEYNNDFLAQIKNKVKKPVRKMVNTVQAKTMIFKACIDIGVVDNAVAQAITKNQLKSVYIDFLDLIEWLQDYCIFAPSKQIFCAFAGITNNNYNWLIQYGTDEQKEILNMIDSYIVDISIEQAQQGYTKETTTKFRMKAKEVGHNIIEATPVDDLLENAKFELDEIHFRNLLANAVPKQIEKK